MECLRITCCPVVSAAPPDVMIKSEDCEVPEGMPPPLSHPPKDVDDRWLLRKIKTALPLANKDMRF